ncbi:thioredoxin [Leptothermofonsia sp. ETS-13]|uniref:thioredoxin n=1 Tax=Leptothermofonsia sp. ETS-13 TaxID=3035696 RepID=UPI003B9E1D94
MTEANIFFKDGLGMGMSSVQVISDAEFETEVLKADQPVLAYFWASWCGPCRLMSPIVEDLATTYGDRLKVVKLEVDPNPESVNTYQVEGVPALILFKDGKVVETREGALTRQKLEEILNAHLSS